MTPKQILKAVKENGYKRISVGKYRSPIIIERIKAEAAASGLELLITLIDEDKIQGLEYYGIRRVEK